MISNTIVLMAFFVMNACNLLYLPCAKAFPIGYELYGEPLYVRSPMPEPSGAFHTVAVKDLEVKGLSEQMLLPQHANLKKLKGTVFMKRSDGNKENNSGFQKRFYAAYQNAILTGKMTRKEAQDSIAKDVALGKRMTKVAREEPSLIQIPLMIKKRFYVDSKAEKALYGPHKPGDLKMVARYAGKEQLDDSMIYKRDSEGNITGKSGMKKRFFVGQQLAVLHGTMTQEQASESVRKQLNLFKHH